MGNKDIRTIRCQFRYQDNSAGQFGVSSSLDNSVSVHHHCFACIKSVSWIYGKTSRLLAELHRDSLYLMMGKDAWVAGADRREAPGPKPVRLGRRLRLRRQPPGS